MRRIQYYAINFFQVIDEVDVHVIIQTCRELRTLILSGNNYVIPKCGTDCSPANAPKLSKLELLFYAEGGDIVAENNIPFCFWFSTLMTDLNGQYKK